MANFKMQGKITKVSDEKAITEKFTIKEFILHVDGKYPQDIKFQVSNKMVNIVDKSKIGQEVEVHFYINGRGTKTGYWNTLSCVAVSRVEAKPATTRDTGLSGGGYMEDEPPF
jgi:PDZ domain-containing secreted protein